MAAIKITLSTDTRLRAPGITAEAAWLQHAAELHYPLNVVPLRAGKGDWVYFIRAGHVVARARIVDVKRVGKARRSYTRVLRPAPAADLKIAKPMKIARKPLRHGGFRGLRYVRNTELARFQACFR